MNQWFTEPVPIKFICSFLQEVCFIEIFIQKYLSKDV